MNVTMNRPSREALAALFKPRNVALIGASDRSAWSNSVFARFGEYGHEGTLFAVNKNGTEAHGLAGYRHVAEIPAPVDTAFIYVPAPTVADALRDAAAAGVRNAVILSSGFAEAGDEGAALQAELALTAAETEVTVLGPNSLGFANFADHAFCTAIRSRLPVRTGRLAIVSQSGAVASELAKWGHAQGIGLSFLCATGNEAQVGVADVVEYLVDDAGTDAIALYLEGINDAERFMQAAARAHAVAKPIVLLKIGRSGVSQAVAQAHTGSLVGDDRVFDAMCRQFGITRVSSIEELVTTSDFLGKIGPIDPPFVGMASVSGGACAMYADLAQLHSLALPPYAPETQAALRGVLPTFAATLNPLDVTGVAVQNPALWADVIPLLVADPGMGVIVTSYNLPNTTEELNNLKTSFEAIAQGYARAGVPPMILSFSIQDMDEVQAAVRDELGLAITLPNLDYGVRALAHLQRWSAGLLLETAVPLPTGQQTKAAQPRTERAVLNHLAAHGVSVIPAVVARRADEAVAAAREFGGAVVLKIASPDIAHKSEAGGVRLDLQGDEVVSQAFEEIVRSANTYVPDARIDGVIVSPMRSPGTELIVGVARDPLWGLVIVVGLGGVFTEALDDSQVRLLPVTAADVRDMLGELRGAKILHGFRGSPPADMVALSASIAAIGDAALALGPRLAALEVNPLRVNGAEVECFDGLAIYEA